MLITSDGKIECTEQVQTLRDPQMWGEYIIIEMPDYCKNKTFRIVMEEIDVPENKS